MQSDMSVSRAGIVATAVLQLSFVLRSVQALVQIISMTLMLRNTISRLFNP